MIPRSRVLLYLSAAGASCALYRRGALLDVRSLPGGEEGWEAFNDFLLRHPDTAIAIAVDTVDEVYRLEALPRVHGADRREMTERRLRQLVHQSPYRAALRQGKVVGPTAHERYLLMGLTNADLIRPWLDIAHLRAAHLAGIWLLPALTIPLARRLDLVQGRLLLVSEQTGGLRLSYLDDGELRFSRLAPVDGTGYDDALRNYAEEIERTRQSLAGQRLLTRSEPLRTVLIDPLNTLDGLHALLPESSGFRCERVPRATLIDTLGLPPSLLAESSDALYLRLLASAPAGANLMTAEQHALTRAYWLRRGLHLATGVWLGLTLGAAVVLALDAWRLQRATAAQMAEETAHRAREAAVLDPAGGVDAVRTRLRAMDAWRALPRPEPPPTALFRATADTVRLHPSIRAQRLDWNDAGTEALLTVEGEVTPFDGDFQLAHDHVREFAETLRTRLAGSHQVVVTLWPLDASPQQTQEGEFGHSTVNARFRIEAKTKP